MDLYLALPPTTGMRDMPGGLPDTLLSKVREHLDIITHTVVVPALVIWPGKGQSKARVRLAPLRVRNDGPLPLLHRIRSPEWRLVFGHCFTTLLGGQPLTDRDGRQFGNRFGEQSADERVDVRLATADFECGDERRGGAVGRRLRRRL